MGDQYPTNGGSVLTIVEYINANNVVVSFESGYTKTTSAGAIRSGGVKDKLLPAVFGVGFIGTGKHKPYYSSKTQSPAYTVWTGIMERCYGVNQARDNPSYVECIVDVDWHNFQNFAEWYYSNIVGVPNPVVDKDVLSGSAKMYSSNTCCILSREENAMEQTGSRTTEYVFKHTETAEVVQVSNLSEFGRSIGVRSGSVSNEVAGKRKSPIKGWRFINKVEVA